MRDWADGEGFCFLFARLLLMIRVARNLLEQTERVGLRTKSGEKHVLQFCRDVNFKVELSIISSVLDLNVVPSYILFME